MGSFFLFLWQFHDSNVDNTFFVNGLALLYIAKPLFHNWPNITIKRFQIPFSYANTDDVEIPLYSISSR